MDPLHAVSSGQQRIGNSSRLGRDGRATHAAHERRVRSLRRDRPSPLCRRKGCFYAAPFDLRRLEFSGAHVPVVEGVRALISGVGQYDVAASGTLVYLPGPVQTGRGRGSRRACSMTRAGARCRRTCREGAMAGFVPRQTASGSRSTATIGAKRIIWVHDLAGSGARQRLTFEGRNQFPVWSARRRTHCLSVDARRRHGCLGATRRRHRSGAATHDPALRARRTFPKTGRRMVSFFRLLSSETGSTRWHCSLCAIAR